MGGRKEGEKVEENKEKMLGFSGRVGGVEIKAGEERRGKPEESVE